MGSRTRTGNNHRSTAAKRDTGRKPRSELNRSTPQQIADAIAFENGLGGGSDSEYRNIVRAAELSYEAGLAARAQGDQPTAQPTRADKEADTRRS